MYEFRTINESLANPLWKCKGSLTFIVFSLWLFLGPPFFYERFAKGMVWTFCWPKLKIDLKNSPSLLVLDSLAREESKIL